VEQLPLSLAPKRAGLREIVGDRERFYDVKWGNSCGLVWCMDWSFAMREDRDLNMLYE
jgi:hypothetical protein